MLMLTSGHGRIAGLWLRLALGLILSTFLASASLAKPVTSVVEGKALIAKSPNDPVAYMAYAEYLQASGDRDSAAQVLEIGRTKAESSAELMIALGTVYEKLDHLGKAEATTRAALVIDPKSVMGHVRMGEIYFQLGWPQSGMESFQVAHELAPEMALPKVRLVGGLVEQNKLSAAEDECLKFIASDVENADLWLALGQVFESQNKLREAFTTYGQVLTLDNNKAEAYARQGRLFCRFGQYDAGKTACAQALALDDSNLLAHAYMGIACSNLGEGETARKHAKIAESGGMNMNAVWTKLTQ